MIKHIFQIAGKPALLVKYILLSILSGMFSFAFMAFVNFLINEMMAGKAKTYNIQHIAIFAGIVFFFVLSRRIFSISIINFSQRVFWTIRKEILQLMLRSEYEQFVSFKTALHASLVRDVNVLTIASMNVIQFSSSVIVIMASFIYMAIISPLLFAVTLAVLATGVLVYYRSMQHNEGYLKKARDLEDSFILSFNALLHGFKEIHLDPNKGIDIFDKEVSVLEDKSITNNRKAYVGFLNNQIIGQVLFNCLIGVLLLGLAILLQLPAHTVVNFLFIVLFLLGATESVMVILPSLMQAKVSIERVAALQKDLESKERLEYSAGHYLRKADFNSLVFDNIIYTYHPQKTGSTTAGFSVGPVSLQVAKGEVVFIYGGNGSGKTTFILSVLGLLKPQEGQVYFNGQILNDENYKSYRMLFGVVFSDFYLFEKLFGLEAPDPERVQYYLRLFELEHKVTFQDGAFSSRDLSTGQRKRLALISVLLEDKPLLVLDEWAADQDPHFRKKFYTEIIPLLKQEGFTILAITHDDRYYHCADKLYQMDYGKLKQVPALPLSHPEVVQ
ncbi:cyclic peptide export ABC transporter [Chitinophaga nivalis]|uniref:Cyclic peptide export ABC transporter n=1 Tax=Chitinophaga nivalis TaxID=2991709 RepID=A0ABT3IJ27_9BACT|nr:cyclic peptide export ABC transporter [Chitinophaga nivalis]MCW3466348.1 cyclic peptide export ABC transporter [Chitinophaga nivalis]MCW3483961.1 cyclic peptide export ABC transporter [Chitinophaga nivalis]